MSAVGAGTCWHLCCCPIHCLDFFSGALVLDVVTLNTGRRMKDSEAGPSAEDLSSALGVTILKKGEVDVIAGPEEGQCL